MTVAITCTSTGYTR